MAIYHFSVKTISRGQGRSAIACAAYRSGEKLNCERYGKEQDYTKKTGIEFKKIYAPENTKEQLLERQKLWNAVEKTEKRKDATLAREFEIAFPSELNEQQRQKLLNELCQTIVEKHGVIVDACIHAPHAASGSDERNFHAHIMFTSRQIDLKTGDFAAKKNRDFNREKSSETVSHWRKAFAELTNHHLKCAGHEVRIDHRSYLEQENSLEATKHEGPKVTAMRRRCNADPSLDLPEAAQANDAIRHRNAERIADQELIKGLDQEILASERLIRDLSTDKNKIDIKLERQKKNAIEREIEQNKAIEIELQQKEIEYNHNRFIELQKTYCDFSNDFYSSQSNATQQKKELEKQREKSKKWLSKTDFHENRGMLYHNISYEMLTQYPSFWLSSVEYDEKIKKIDKANEKQRIEIIVKYDIEATVKELRSVAQTLVEKNQELPVSEKPFLEKLGIHWLSRTYTHSYETLSDFDSYVAPALKKLEKRDELRVLRDKERERQEIKFEAQNKKLEEESKQIKLENAKRYENERLYRLEAERQYFNELNFEQKPKKDSDNKFQP